jgi:hypothetical protein
MSQLPGKSPAKGRPSSRVLERQDGDRGLQPFPAPPPTRPRVSFRHRAGDSTGPEGIITTPVRALDVSLPFTLAIDTEFHQACTLSIQVAGRIDDGTVAAKIYRSMTIPGIPKDFDPREYLPPADYGWLFDHMILRPTTFISPRISPSRMLRDVFDIADLQILTRPEGQDLVDSLRIGQEGLPANLAWDFKKRRWRVPALRVTLVGHFLPADFYRIFGRSFLDSLRAADGRGRTIEVGSRKLLHFREGSGKFGSTEPVVEYVRTGDGRLFEVRLRMRDTNLPFGSASLDALSKFSSESASPTPWARRTSATCAGRSARRRRPLMGTRWSTP